MKIEILITPGCSNCSVLEKLFDELNIKYNLIDVTEKPEYLEKYPVFTAPAVIINDNLEFTGIPNKKDLLKKLKK